MITDKKCIFCENNFVVGDTYEKYGEDCSHTKCFEEQMREYRNNPYTELLRLKRQLKQLDN